MNLVRDRLDQVARKSPDTLVVAFACSSPNANLGVLASIYHLVGVD